MFLFCFLFFSFPLFVCLLVLQNTVNHLSCVFLCDEYVSFCREEHFFIGLHKIRFKTYTQNLNSFMPYAKDISVKQMEINYSFRPETYVYVILYCFCTEKATDSDFMNVIQLLGPDDLKKLFYALDIKQRDIHAAERCSTSPELEDFKAIQIFQKWKKDYGKKATRKTHT